MNWVEAAHDATGHKGVSAGYELNHGWQQTYPEISGYLVPTMLRAAQELDRPPLAGRAVEIGDWLRLLQHADGAFPGGMGVDGEPVVFDVGQIVLGQIALARSGHDRTAALDSAGQAAQWLCRAQRPDGAWLSHFGYPNTYSTRVTWAVAEVWRETGDPELLRTVERSLRWTLTRVQPDGWIDGMAFDANLTPWTHTIGYALRGLLRTADVIGDELGDLGEQAVAAATACAERLAGLVSPLDPLLPGEIGPGFTSTAGYACLTGDAQMVTVWLDIARRTGNDGLRARCAAVVDLLADLQLRQPVEPAAVGALPGSWPLSGAFEPLAFPSWATKFLADAVFALADDERE
ncbi:hypothetical protein UK23_45330 [Lentzea aerocolonigenes]|uniref:Squalene cyclase C-terminal domain-containing protein n=1 Tax=Lentzea aerocolonigenes TaxID=68170 RepID=A0A0F0GHG3_LENAE|nr:prenyltransferase/squalene oxidase repeat-containing protein [Lentzea aerocolonigenes]KJK33639.1 hypothetical protein UK23_45330 [Lentzea aerocolonigenes]